MLQNQPNENRVIELPNKKQLLDKRFVVKDNKFYRPNTLEGCYDRSSISKEQFSAGMILFEDAYNGLILAGLKGMDPTKANMPRQKGYKPAEMTANQAYAHRDWSEAMYHEAMQEEMQNVLWHLVVMDNTVSSFHRSRDYTLGLLRLALNVLVRHYKFRKKM